MIERAHEDIRSGIAKPNRILTEEACWKRAVYTLVLDYWRSTPERYALERFTQALISGNIDRRLPRTPAFEQNPFHWVFSALSANQEWQLERAKIFRFGRQLNYAWLHQVPVQFLIGFIYQAGTPSQVEKKGGDGSTELWRDEWINALRAKS